MPIDYKKLSKDKANRFNELESNGQITQIEKQKSIFETQINLFKDALAIIKPKLEFSGYSKGLNDYFDLIDANLEDVLKDLENYTDFSIRVFRQKAGFTNFSLFVYGLGSLFVIFFCPWFIFGSHNFFEFFIRFFTSVIFSFLFFGMGYLINKYGHNIMFNTVIPVLKKSILKSIKSIQNTSNLIIDELKLSSIDTTSFQSSLKDLSTAAEELFKI